MNLPPMVRASQRLPGRPLRDLAGAVRDQAPRAGLTAVKPGARIGVAVGSRGVANLATVVAALVQALRGVGAHPVIIPAMGSHGGATPTGQREILSSLGVTPRTVGAPIRASMAVERLGETAAGVPIWWSREALRCDGVILVNRVKPHTDFRGPIESGLMKMIAVGLGKRQGAATLHALRVPGLRDHMPEVAREIIARGHLLGGLALIENGCGETVSITGVPAAETEAAERRLLRAARRLAPRLPFDELDLLIVDFMGKDVSGTGLDPNVLGRMHMPGEQPEPPRPRIRNVVVLRLTPASHGNALGVGLAEFIPRSLAEAIDWDAVKANAMTSGFLERAKLPLVMDDDRAAIAAGAAVGQSRRPQDLRLLRIRDTAHVDQLWLSPALAAEASSLGLEIVGEPQPLPFDRRGQLRDIAPPGEGDPVGA